MSDKNDKDKPYPLWLIILCVIIGLIVLFLLAFYIEHIGLTDKLKNKLPAKLFKYK